MFRQFVCTLSIICGLAWGVDSDILTTSSEGNRDDLQHFSRLQAPQKLIEAIDQQKIIFSDPQLRVVFQKTFTDQILAQNLDLLSPVFNISSIDRRLNILLQAFAQKQKTPEFSEILMQLVRDLPNDLPLSVLSVDILHKYLDILSLAGWTPGLDDENPLSEKFKLLVQESDRFYQQASRRDHRHQNALIFDTISCLWAYHNYKAGRYSEAARYYDSLEDSTLRRLTTDGRTDIHIFLAWADMLIQGLGTDADLQEARFVLDTVKQHPQYPKPSFFRIIKSPLEREIDSLELRLINASTNAANEKSNPSLSPTSPQPQPTTKPLPDIWAKFQRTGPAA